MSLLIVGSVALDSIESHAGRVKDVVGGSAVYASYAASLFTRPAIVGVVGDDFPQTEVTSLKRKGIDTQGLERVPGGKTFRWGGRYAEDMIQRETLFTELNVFETFQPTLSPSYRSIRDVFLANIDPDLQLDVLRQVRNPRLVVCDTMNLWIDTKRPSLLKLLKRTDPVRKIDALLLNDEEARMLGDAASLAAAARSIARLGVSRRTAPARRGDARLHRTEPLRIIIKKGEHGCMMFGPEGVFAAPALPLAKAKDPTGAGDTFAGGMLGWLAGRALTPANWRRAILAGTAMASFCVEDFGVKRLRGLEREDFRKRVDELRAMMAVGKM
jgi:sugar/nucleoside kinase (ribokinase family)